MTKRQLEICLRLMPAVRAWGAALCLVSAAFPLGFSAQSADPAPQQPAAPSSQVTPSNEMLLLDQESKFEREKTQYLQDNVLDKILGPGKAVVIVDVEMGLQSRNMDMSMDKKKNDKKKNDIPDDEKEPQPAPLAKVLVPGVPMPRSVVSLQPPPAEEDRGGSEKGTSGVMQQKTSEVHANIKKLQVTVLYDKRVSSDKLLAVKQAIIALLKCTEQQLVFTPTQFTETAWQQVLTPKWLIPLFLLLWVLLFLWGPLRMFFKRMAAAMEDKTQKIEETSKVEQEMEEQSEEETDEDQEGEDGAGEGEGGEGTDEDEILLEEDEAMKKFEPFMYVSEQNLKGLAYLLRKEEPWIIALVMSYLKPEFAKEVFVSMPPELQARVAVETATIRQTSLEQVMSIDEYVKKKIDFVLGGIENLLKILNEADKTTRENILDFLRNEKPLLYERVREEVLLFEDLLNFPDTAIQGIVREIGTESLSRALRGASPEFLNKFFTNMSAGASALLKESMDYGRPLTPEQIDEERKSLMDLVAKLEKDGKINIRKKRKAGILDGEEAADDSEPLALGAGRSVAALPAPAVAAPALPAGGSGANAEDSFQMAAVFYETGRYSEAVQHFHFAIQAQPDFWQAYQYLGAAYAAQGMTNQAMGAYERMLELHPDPDLHAWVENWKAQVASLPQAGAL